MGEIKKYWGIGCVKLQLKIIIIQFEKRLFCFYIKKITPDFVFFARTHTMKKTVFLDHSHFTYQNIFFVLSVFVLFFSYHKKVGDILWKYIFFR